MNSRPRYSDLYRGIRALKDISIQERCLLYTLATFADPDGSNIFPSHETLAQYLEIAESTLRTWIASLRKKKYLISEQRKGYYMQYRLLIPGITPVIATMPATDISREESQWLPDEDDSPTDKRPAIRPPDGDATVKVPVIKAPATVPVTPPVSAAEEEYQKRLDFIWYCVCKEHEKVGGSYERVLREAQRKGVLKNDVDWLWREYERDVGEISSSGSQPINELTSKTAIIPEGSYQP